MGVGREERSGGGERGEEWGVGREERREREREGERARGESRGVGRERGEDGEEEIEMNKSGTQYKCDYFSPMIPNAEASCLRPCALCLLAEYLFPLSSMISISLISISEYSPISSTPS